MLWNIFWVLWILSLDMTGVFKTIDIKLPSFFQKKMLLSISASPGPVFRRYLLNRPIDNDETWAQGISACDLVFCIVLLWQNTKISCSCRWLVMLSLAPAQFGQCSSRAKGYGCQSWLGRDPWSIHQPRPPYQAGALASARGVNIRRVG